MTIAYFCVSGLDLLGELTEEDMNATTKWVLSLQVCVSAVASWVLLSPPDTWSVD